MRVSIRAVARTDVGKKRDHNEDAFLCAPDDGVFVLADGVGGAAAGEVASEIAIETVREAFVGARDGTLGDRLGGALVAAHERILERAGADPALEGMGAAVVAVACDPVEGRLALANVGDARGYRLRAGVAEQLSEDHTLVRELLNQGRIQPEDIPSLPHRHVLTQALGASNAVVPAVRMERVEPGDTFVLCSDGIHDLVTSEEIASAVATSGRDLDAACDRLVALALDRGGHDNATILLVACEPDASGATLAPVAVAPRRDRPPVRDARPKHVDRPKRRAMPWVVAMGVTAVLMTVALQLGRLGRVAIAPDGAPPPAREAVTPPAPPSPSPAAVTPAGPDATVAPEGLRQVQAERPSPATVASPPSPATAPAPAPPSPPRIAAQMPAADRAVEVREGGATEFRVRMAEPVTGLSYVWYLDDREVGRGATWSFRPPALPSDAPAERRIHVVVADAAGLQAPRVGWSVRVLPAPPTITTSAPRGEAVAADPHTRTEFSAGATRREGETAVEYEWTVDGRSAQRGEQGRFAFEGEPGRHVVEVAAIDGRGLRSSTRRWRVDVARAAPAPSEVATPSADERVTEAAAREWLARYQAAMEHRDLGALQRLGVVRDDAQAKRLDAALARLPLIGVRTEKIGVEPDGQHATVAFRRSHRDGSDTNETGVVSCRLGKGAGGLVAIGECATARP